MSYPDTKVVEFDTPSGTNQTALDKFILSYAERGYEWINRAKATYFQPKTKEEEYVKKAMGYLTQKDDDIVFVKNDSVLIAEAIYNEDTGWIQGYDITMIK